jgi:hypothetical protein
VYAFGFGFQFFIPSACGSVSHPQFSGRTGTASTVLLASSREEEIAKLEAQLRKLREEEDAKDIQNETMKELKAEEAAVSRKLEKMKGKVMLLSETDILGDSGLVAEDDTSTTKISFNLPSILGVVLGVILLVAFAQIPVGQEDLQRYSATGS